MKLVIKGVNIPKLLKYKNTFSLMESAEILFGVTDDNSKADIQMDFDTDNFVISNKFLNSKESVIVECNSNSFVIDRCDFDYIELL